MKWSGVDDFNRPIWQHTSSGVQYCLADELYDRDDARSTARPWSTWSLTTRRFTSAISYRRHPKYMRCIKALASQVLPLSFHQCEEKHHVELHD